MFAKDKARIEFDDGAVEGIIRAGNDVINGPILPAIIHVEAEWIVGRVILIEVGN